VAERIGQSSHQQCKTYDYKKQANQTSISKSNVMIEERPIMYDDDEK